MKEINPYYIKCEEYEIMLNGVPAKVVARALYQHKKYKDRFFVQAYPSHNKAVRLFTTRSLSRAKDVAKKVRKVWNGNFKVYEVYTDNEVKPKSSS